MPNPWNKYTVTLEKNAQTHKVDVFGIDEDDADNSLTIRPFLDEGWGITDTQIITPIADRTNAIPITTEVSDE